MYHRTGAVPGMWQNVMEGVFLHLMTERESKAVQVSAVSRCGTGSVDHSVLRDAVPSSSAVKHPKKNSLWTFSWCKIVHLVRWCPTGRSHTTDWLQLHLRLATATVRTGCSHTTDWLQSHHRLATATPPTGYSHTTDWLQPHHRSNHNDVLSDYFNNYNFSKLK